MNSILKILVGLKLTILLLFLSLGTGIEFTNLEQGAGESSIIIPADEIRDMAAPLKTCSKPNSLSELGLYIEL